MCRCGTVASEIFPGYGFVRSLYCDKVQKMNAMQSFFQSLPYFVILIGLLVFIHEAGHFLFAKLFKVKVHVFSLGFGPKLIGFQKGETLYKISALPLGGYVKMLGEDPSETVAPEDVGRAFSDKKAWQRFLIIIGGPTMNLLFPLFLHFGVGLSFTQVMPAELGFMLPDMPAWQAGMRPGDKILSIDGEPVKSFDDIVRIVTPAFGQKLSVRVTRGGKEQTFDLIPKPTDIPVILEEFETVGRIGVAPDYLSTVIGVGDANSTAYLAGLRPFDYIVSVDGKAVERLVDLEAMLISAAGTTVGLTVRSFKEDAAPPFDPFENQFDKTARTVALSIPTGIQSLADLGIESSIDYVAHVTPGGVAEAVGLKRGDKLVSLNGAAASLSGIFSVFNSKPAETVELGWTRVGKPFTSNFKQKFIPAGEAGDLGLKRDTYDRGFWGWIGKTVEPDKISNPSLVLGALRYSLAETWSGIRMIGIGFKLLFQGKVSMRSIGGPLMIGQLAGQAGQMGASSFFWVMALISLNLGLLNLLPIPVLDGGQIALIVIESVTRRPISRVIKERIMLVGVAMLLLLMVFATWNDIARFVVG